MWINSQVYFNFLSGRFCRERYTVRPGSEQLAVRQQLLELSNDIYNLTRLINSRLGTSRKDDTIPYKVWANPPLTGPNAGKVVDREYFQKLLSMYYQKRGWDENGNPPAELEKKFDD